MSIKQKKYAFLIGTLKKGGAERSVAWLANGLAEKGHQVVIFVFKYQVDFYLNENVRVIDLEIDKVGNKVLKLFKLYFGLQLQLIRARPKYLIAFTRVAGQLAGATLYPRVIVRYETYPFSLRKKRLWGTILVFNLPNVRKVICNSEVLLSHLKPYYLRKSKLTRVYNPTVPPQEVNREEGILPSWKLKPYFIFVGRLSRVKSIDVAIRAFAQSGLSEKMNLIIVGDGSEMNPLKKLANTLNLNGIIFTGFLKNPYPLMKGARALLLQSQFEGSPNVLVEALSLNVPVISSDCLTGPSEIVTEGLNGHLFKVGDQKALTDLMLRVATDEQHRDFLASNAVKSIRKFEADTVFQRWLDVLENNVKV